ncbi:MAG: hypothetical protein KatS3mg068_2421 [Candidatus Sericytochromatia bacterium]|nr:MAG: hypothetical protein KatS3mg068_2421 [Candidatus Sericytochromatia bacterium]
MIKFRIKKIILKYLFFLILFQFLFIYPTYSKELVVSFIDINQGDSVLIQLPNNQNILIDGGDKEYSKYLEKFLKDRKIKQIDIMIITHPHIDHYGGLLNIAKKFEIKHVLDSGAKTNAITYLELLKILNSKKVKFSIARRGDKFSFENNLSLEILSPKEPLLKNTRSDINNSSIVAKLRYNNVSFLFTGDIENEIEEQLLRDNINISSDILKIAHHGSRHSSSEEFLKKVNPSIAIISCGLNNSYGHPHKQLLNRLNRLKIQYYRTDLNGDIIITSDGYKYYVSFSKNDTKYYQEEQSKILNINTASLEELISLPGIGKKTAKNIINNRPYYHINDLLKVKGINKNKLEILSKLVTVE